MKEITADLLNHVGGAEQASAAERYLVDRLAVDIVRLEMLDAEMFGRGGQLSEHDGRVAHALRNSVRLGLARLGLKTVKAPEPTVAELLAEAEAAS